MGYRKGVVATAKGLRTHRSQQIALVHAVMLCVLILVFVQFLLLTAALEGYLARRPVVLLPAGVASGVCFAATCWLVRTLASARH